MVRKKYAIRFPGMQYVERDSSISIFSEEAIIETEYTFIKTFDALGSLLGLIAQREKTKELSEQLEVQKITLDEIVKNEKEQQKIKTEEYIKRLEYQLKSEQEAMNLEMKKMLLEIKEKMNTFSISFEEAVKNNQMLFGIIRKEKEILNKIQPYIELWAKDYSQRREYVRYCEMQRRSLKQADKYLNEMV